MSDSDKPFTVSDRRLFTPDGRRRDDNEPKVSEESPPEPSSSPPEREHSRPGPIGPADFGEFLLSLGAQAGMLLSGQGLPEGADVEEGRAGAQAIISILEMLKDKTEGRRTAKENEILEGLLFELRMAYVEKSRASGS